MRRFALVVCLLLVSLVVASPAMAATTQALKHALTRGSGGQKPTRVPPPSYSRSAAPAPLPGSGATSVTEVVIFENFDPATSCADVVLRRTITLEDGSTLVLMETGTVCFPGKSTLAPGAAKSFGNPFNIEATFTIVAGTGVFAGAQGSGTDVIKAAGDTGHSGSLARSRCPWLVA